VTVLKHYLQSQAVRLAGVIFGILALITVGYAMGWWTGLGRSVGGWFWWGLLFLLVVGIIVAMLWGIPRYREKRFVDRLKSEDRKAPEDDAEESRRQLRDKMIEAIRTLERSPDLKQRGGLALYALPWYLLIGASQSGKTTLLQGVASLYAPFGRPHSSTDGSTQSCDWWFFNDAIILDTSGRYALPTQVERDRAQWYRFLRLLRHYRERQPINGVIIAVAADTLVSKRPEDLRHEATELRKRIDETIRELGVDFPVYLLITRCDLIEGFTEFCGCLPERTLTQVFGFANETRPQEGNQQEHTAPALRFRSMYEAMLERLQQLRLSILHEKLPSPTLRQKVFCFPEEFRALQQPLNIFVETLFNKNPIHHTPFLRGLFFCSAQQQGTPLSFLRQEWHFDDQGSPLTGGAKNYFLHDLFAVILPGDKYCVKPTMPASRMQRLKALAGFTGCIGLCLLIVLPLTQAFLSDRKISASPREDLCIASVEQESKDPLLDQIDACRQVVQRLIDQNGQRPSWSKLLFNQSSALEETLRQGYVEKFEAEVLAPLDTRIAERLSTGSETLLLAFLLIKRLELIKSCLSEAECPVTIRNGLQPDYQLMLAASRQPSSSQEDATMLGNAYEAYLHWSSGAKEALHREQEFHIECLQRWFASTQFAPQLLVWANQNHPAVSLQAFWELPASEDGAKNMLVEGAYSQIAWEQGILPFLQRANAAVPDVEPFLQTFIGEYRTQYFEQWRRFLVEFPRGERAWGETRESRHRLASKLLDHTSPYNRIVDVAFENLKPLLPAVRSADAPQSEEATRSVGTPDTGIFLPAVEVTIAPWLRVLQRYFGSESRTAYLDAFQQISTHLAGDSTAEKGFQLAQPGFQEGQPTEKSVHPVLKAWWIVSQFRGSERSGAESEESPFRPLTQRPVLFLWSVILEEAGIYLQERWNELLLEVKDLSPGQKREDLYGKGGKVGAFVNGPAAGFLIKRGDEYLRRSLLQGEISFTDAFLTYLQRARAGGAQPELEEVKRRIQIRIDPATVVADANLKAAKTELILECDAGRQVLETVDSSADRTFIWTAKSCFDTSLRVYLSDTSGLPLGSLERRYPALTRFLDQFSGFQRGFRLADFTVENAAQLSPYRIRSITLKARFDPEDRQQILRDTEVYKRYQGNMQAQLDLPASIVAISP
jgi:type VI secretion system protein ImpL